MSRSIFISSVGLATAQGSAADLAAGRPLAPPRPVPWDAGPWSTCGLTRPARDLDLALAGAERWNALACRALAECLGDDPPAPGTPLFVASCNGGAAAFDAEEWRRSFDTARLLDATLWAGARLPVASAACASGLHALFLARRWLEAGAPEHRPPERRPPEAVVLAADIVPPATHRNFEALRILTPELEAPWQSTTSGFLPGEAAVALRLSASGPGTAFGGPVLGHDLAGDEGLAAALGGLRPGRPGLVVGQGTGPFEVDRVELAAIRHAVGRDVPLTTPLYCFGHTLGASGLLSVALATLLDRGATLPALALPARRAADGRPLVGDPATATDGDRSLVVCRALGGACAAVAVGTRPESLTVLSQLRSSSTRSDVSERRPRSKPPEPRRWLPPGEPPPLYHPLLRRLAAELPRRRPEEPPDLLLVRLDEPLVPPERAAFGGRILPSAVLEMTPGRLAILAARAWGFQGPALCLVGGAGSPESLPANDRCRASVLYLSSTGTLHVDGTSGSAG